MAYNQKTVEIWCKSYKTINSYRNKLGEHEKYFDTLLYSVSDISYSIDNINSACEYLKNKARTVSNRDLKEALNDFVITSEDCYDQDNFPDFKKSLKNKGMLPNRSKHPEKPHTYTYIPPQPKPYNPPAPPTNDTWWNRCNYKVKIFSERFWQNKNDIHIYLYMGLTAIAIVAGIVNVIITWANEGFWSALGTFLISALAVIGAAIVIFILLWPLMLLFRGLTYNLTILTISMILITIGVAVPISIYSFRDFSASEENTSIETREKQTTTYVCTANTLIVRSRPDKTSASLGTIKNGDEIEVHEIVNGFAKISWNGQFAYVSLTYIHIKQ